MNISFCWLNCTVRSISGGYYLAPLRYKRSFLSPINNRVRTLIQPTWPRPSQVVARVAERSGVQMFQSSDDYKGQESSRFRGSKLCARPPNRTSIPSQIRAFFSFDPSSSGSSGSSSGTLHVDSPRRTFKNEVGSPCTTQRSSDR